MPVRWAPLLNPSPSCSNTVLVLIAPPPPIPPPPPPLALHPPPSHSLYPCDVLAERRCGEIAPLISALPLLILRHRFVLPIIHLHVDSPESRTLLHAWKYSASRFGDRITNSVVQAAGVLCSNRMTTQNTDGSTRSKRNDHITGKSMFSVKSTVSRESVRTVRDGEPRTATSTFTQLLSSCPVPEGLRAGKLKEDGEVVMVSRKLA